MAEGKKKSNLGKGCLIVASVIFGLGVLGTIVGEDKTKNNAEIGPTTTAAVEPQGKEGAPPKLTIELNETAQQARYQACLKRMEDYQNLGVWKHGGVRPGVDASAWELMPEAERTEVFDIAGCIAGGGQIGERIVTVAEEGNGPEIETRRVANDRDFAAAVAAK